MDRAFNIIDLGVFSYMSNNIVFV